MLQDILLKAYDFFNAHHDAIEYVTDIVIGVIIVSLLAHYLTERRRKRIWEFEFKTNKYIPLKANISICSALDEGLRENRDRCNDRNEVYEILLKQYLIFNAELEKKISFFMGGIGFELLRQDKYKDLRKSLSDIHLGIMLYNTKAREVITEGDLPSVPERYSYKDLDELLDMLEGLKVKYPRL